MAPAVDVEDLLAGARDLHRTSGELRETARGDLVGEGAEIAAEAAAHRRGDDADGRRRRLYDFRYEAVHEVGRLGRATEPALAIRPGRGGRRLWLYRRSPL